MFVSFCFCSVQPDVVGVEMDHGDGPERVLLCGFNVLMSSDEPSEPELTTGFLFIYSSQTFVCNHVPEARRRQTAGPGEAPPPEARRGNSWSWICITVTTGSTGRTINPKTS